MGQSNGCRLQYYSACAAIFYEVNAKTHNRKRKPENRHPGGIPVITRSFHLSMYVFRGRWGVKKSRAVHSSNGSLI
jgi:hypothetical protein